MDKDISFTEDYNYTVYDKSIEELAIRFNIKDNNKVQEVIDIMKKNDITDNGIEFLNIYDIYVADELSEEDMFNN
ncbi:TPA: hypothetical protein PBB95_002585 [Staphylococcus aureus]|uniref:hypothetical protein n=1 Tax=Staphylococcaceae TaxID=90964 RepID=UPI00065BF454|nr:MULTISPECIES: hypothetical protein [Staphylococcaceae]EGQ3259964.1 hypothetical protein [Staphylococcus pseudintermedius]EJD5651485.1 hypothetical protein [Staphylococcus pseudintermedius]EJG0093191.1 hypothetical protein [Staphylococcus pseudintermedius]EKO1102669.1 hypothetical protein [Staphylococcus pseudintermedius]ELJ9313999.1 hypothetical protein [Staphylococcus pseudintermedius]